MDTIFTDGQLTKAIETMRQKGMTPERFNHLLASGIFADVCDAGACLDDRNAVRNALKLDATEVAVEPLILEINYGDSLKAMIAAGHYDWVNGDITPKRFPIKGTGIQRFETKVFHFGRDMSSEEVVEAMKAEGFDAAQIEHLLAFGAKRPEEQRKYPIIGLGSVTRVRGYRCVPYLYRGGGERGLGLGWWSLGWNGYDRFLGVRKLSSAA